MFTSALGATSRSSAEQSDWFVVVPVDNPRYCGNEMFRAFEDYYSPRIRQLRARYGLDAVVAGETDEWKRILLLRHWIKSDIAIDNGNPTQTQGDTFAILDAALEGGKFHCTHVSIVQHAVLNSFGYVTRRLGCGPGLKDDGGTWCDCGEEVEFPLDNRAHMRFVFRTINPLPCDWSRLRDNGDICGSVPGRLAVAVGGHRGLSAVEGRQLRVAVSRRLLGLRFGDFALEFKWIDNAQSPGDILNTCVDGDAAPDGRFRYRYDTRSSRKSASSRDRSVVAGVGTFVRRDNL